MLVFEGEHEAVDLFLTPTFRECRIGILMYFLNKARNHVDDNDRISSKRPVPLSLIFLVKFITKSVTSWK